MGCDKIETMLKKKEHTELKIRCLDKGYVRLVTWMPWAMGEAYQIISEGGSHDALVERLEQNDLTVVNAARVSFLKESYELTDKDVRLIRFLAGRYETSPFRHAILSFEVKAPLMVARQWFKYRVGSTHTDDAGFDDPMYARNESSRRYVTSEPEFYIPSKWRSPPANRKQGSGEEPVDCEDRWMDALVQYIEEGLRLYHSAIKVIAPEQARLFLPAYSLYLTWRWTASLAAVAHFLNERLADKAQAEIREYAYAVWRLAQFAYPISLAALVEGGE